MRREPRWALAGESASERESDGRDAICPERGVYGGAVEGGE